MLIIGVTFYIAEARVRSYLENPSSNSYQPLNYNPRFCATLDLHVSDALNAMTTYDLVCAQKVRQHQNFFANRFGLALMQRKLLFQMELVIEAGTE